MFAPHLRFPAGGSLLPLLNKKVRCSRRSSRSTDFVPATAIFTDLGCYSASTTLSNCAADSFFWKCACGAGGYYYVLRSPWRRETFDFAAWSDGQHTRLEQSDSGLFAAIPRGRPR